MSKKAIDWIAFAIFLLIIAPFTLLTKNDAINYVAIFIGGAVSIGFTLLMHHLNDVRKDRTDLQRRLDRERSHTQAD
jgi:hypothetical protein